MRESPATPKPVSTAGKAVVPASEMSHTLKHVPELKRLRGKNAMENEILRKDGGDQVAKMDCSLTLIPGGRPVMRVCEVFV